MATVDFDKPGKYPIVLSDALLGLSTKEVYTGIRYNHKPDPSNDSKSSLHIEPSSEDDTTNYDLSLNENSDRYSYQGIRKSGDGQYVLIFNPEKKHFVLHRIDTNFDMNLVKTPWDQDAASLKNDYTQIEYPTKPPTKAQTRASTTTARATKGRGAAAAKNEPKKPKAEKPKRAKPVVREPTPEEEEDSDDGLTVEYPDGPSSHQYQYQSTPVFQREESEEISDEDEDAEGEFEDIVPERNQDVDHLRLPSPANHGNDIEDDMELDLEAELEQALKATQHADESSESEEE